MYGGRSDSTPGAEKDPQIADGYQWPNHQYSGEGSSEGGAVEEFRIVFSVPWIVRGAERPQDAINIAVSEVGKRTEKTGRDIRSVDISVQRLLHDEGGGSTEALLLVAETALVGILLTVEVRASSAAEAETLARREIGPHLPDTPLTTVEVTQ
jgi:uncharacterized protein (UPF0212 family)